MKNTVGKCALLGNFPLDLINYTSSHCLYELLIPFVCELQITYLFPETKIELRSLKSSPQKNLGSILQF